MSAGIEVRNNNNIIQITEKYRNMALFDCYNMEGDFTLELNNNRIPAFSCDGGFMCIVYSRPSTIMSNATHFEVRADGPITVYTYGYLDYPSTHGYFEVYNEQGSLCFSSAQHYMKVLGSLSGNCPSTIPVNQTFATFNFNPSQKVAVVPGTNAVGYWGNANGWEIKFSCFYWGYDKVTLSFYEATQQKTMQILNSYYNCMFIKAVTPI